MVYIYIYRPPCGLSTVYPLVRFLGLPALLLSYSKIRLLFRHSQILFIDLHHFVRCLIAVCHVSRDWPDLRKLLQLSLKRSFSLPTGREPDASSPYRSCFCGLLSSIRQTWPSQRSRLFTNITSMSSVPARFSTSSLLTYGEKRLNFENNTF